MCESIILYNIHMHVTISSLHILNNFLEGTDTNARIYSSVYIFFHEMHFYFSLFNNLTVAQ